MFKYNFFIFAFYFSKLKISMNKIRQRPARIQNLDLDKKIGSKE